MVEPKRMMGLEPTTFCMASRRHGVQESARACRKSGSGMSGVQVGAGKRKRKLTEKLPKLPRAHWPIPAALARASTSATTVAVSRVSRA